MPIYTYRREDGTEFEIRQKFSDDALTVDPETGQKVQRVIHAAGIVFKGSGFYVNDSKSSKSSTATPPATNGNTAEGANGNGANSNGTKEASSATDAPKSDTSSDAAD